MTNYTPQDIRIAASGIVISTTVVADVDFVGLIPVGSNKVEFQFPPRIKSDARTGEWSAVATTGGKSNSPGLEEPIFLYQGGNPRKIQLEWDYIIDGDLWPITRIKKNLAVLRKYAANATTTIKKNFDQLLLKVKFYNIGGEQLMSYRSDGVTITHDDTLIEAIDTKAGGTQVFPLKSVVSMILYSWPKASSVDKDAKVSVASGQIKTLPDWY